jgi:hypothetical protein
VQCTFHSVAHAFGQAVNGALRMLEIEKRNNEQLAENGSNGCCNSHNNFLETIISWLLADLRSRSKL